MLVWKRRSHASDPSVGCFPHCIPKRSRTPASPRRTPRHLDLQLALRRLRWKTVELRDPDGKQAPLRLQLVHVREASPPAEVEALEWFLLTTLELPCLMSREIGPKLAAEGQD